MTIPQIIIRADISEYLAVNAIKKAGKNGGGIPSYLPSLIRQVNKTVSRMYNLSPTNKYLIGNANYLFSLCREFGIEASYLIASGGSIPSTIGTALYSLPITDVYTALIDGEFVLPLNLPTGAKIIFVQKSILTLTSSQYSYTSPNLTLLGGITLGAGEELFYEYVVPI